MFVCKYIMTTAYCIKGYFTIFVLLHLSKSTSFLPGLGVCCGREPTFVHPNTSQLAWPLCNSRHWDGNTSKNPEGKVVSTLFSHENDDLLSMSVANSNLIHLPRAAGGWNISSLLPCVLGLCIFALKRVPSLWCYFREWYTGISIATLLHNIRVQVLKEKNPNQLLKYLTC